MPKINVKVIVSDYLWMEKTISVCGGSARIKNTRIPVWSIVEAKKMNFSDTRILASYPSLSLMDIENALIYYARNREEVELDLAEKMKTSFKKKLFQVYKPD